MLDTIEEIVEPNVCCDLGVMELSDPFDLDIITSNRAHPANACWKNVVTTPGDLNYEMTTRTCTRTHTTVTQL